MTFYYVNRDGLVKTATVAHANDPGAIWHNTPEAALNAALEECAKEHAELRRRRVALNKRQANLRKQLGLAP